MRRYLMMIVLGLASIATAQTSVPGWNVTGGSGGGGGSGTVNSGTVGQIASYTASGTAVSGTNTFIGAINALAFGVKADVQIIYDASWTNGANPATVTSGASDPCFTAGDVGKIVFGTNWNKASSVFYQASTVKVPQGTITSFTDCHDVVISTVPTSTQVSNGVFAWGHDDATAIASAITAAGAGAQCLAVQFPAGVMFTSTGLGNTTPPCILAPDNTNDAGIGYIGWALRATVIVPLPSLSTSNATTCNGGSGSTCFFGTPTGVTVTNLAIFGMGNNATAFGSAKSCLSIGTDYYLKNVECDAWGASDTNFTGLTVAGGTTPGQDATDVVINGAGSLGCRFNATTQWQFGYCGGNLTAALQVDSGAVFFSYSSGFAQAGGTAGNSAIINGEWHSLGDAWLVGGSNTGQNLVQVNNGGIFTCDGSRFSNSLGSGVGVIRLGNGGADAVTGYFINGCKITSTVTSGLGLILNGSSVRAFVSGTTISAPTGGNQILTANSAVAQDMGGNIYSGAATMGIAAEGAWQGISGISALHGNCTGTATSSTTLGLYGLGENATTTCATATTNLGVPMTKNGSILGLLCSATHAGVSASSGVVTALKNGSTTTTTCTIGTGTSCTDQAHTSAFALGDVLSVQFTTQGSEVLAGVSCTVITN